MAESNLDKEKKDKDKKDKDKKEDKSESDEAFEKELKQLEKPLKHKQIHIVQKITDIDNDKVLTFNEFLRLIR